MWLNQEKRGPKSGGKSPNTLVYKEFLESPLQFPEANSKENLMACARKALTIQQI